MANRLINSPRQLSQSVIADWGTRMGSQKAAFALVNSPRLEARVLDRLLEINNTPTICTEIESGSAKTLEAMRSDPNRFNRICGLVYYGSMIRNMVDGEKYARISSLFPKAELVYSCRQEHILVHNNESEIDPKQFVLIVERIGAACARQWRAGLKPEIQQQLALMDGTDTNQADSLPSRISADLANEIVDCAVQFIEQNR